MRKVKLLAFVLAALMVVAAFAGCGTKEIEANVTDLDERVSKLEELLNKVNDSVEKGATADQINELLDAITANKTAADKADSDLADKLGQIAKDNAAALEALKKDLEGDDTALQSAIAKLEASLKANTDAIAAANALIAQLDKDIDAGDAAVLEAVKKLLEDQESEIAGAIKDLSDKIAAEDKAQTELDTAKNNYTGKLEIIKGQLDANSNLYSSTEYTTIATALITGVANIKNATTVEDVVKYYGEAEKAYTDCTPLNVQLKNAYDALYGAITHDSKTAVDDYKKLADKAKALYGASGKEIIVGTGDNAINLVDAAATFDTVYKEAVKIKDAAKKLDDSIKAYTKVYVVNGPFYAGGANKYNLGTLESLNTSYTNYVNGSLKTYKNYLDYDAMLALVTRKAELDARNAEKTRLQTAIANYAFYGKLEGAEYKNVFQEYIDALKVNVGKSWFNKVATVYNVVDARVNQWVEDYSIDAENKGAIICQAMNKVDSTANHTFYQTYCTYKDYANRYLAKYNTFVSEYKDRVVKLNAIEKFTNADVAELVAIQEALFESENPWCVVVLREANGTVTKLEENLQTTAAQLKEMFKQALGRETLFSFKPGTDAEIFYTTTYDQAIAVKNVINAKIKNLVDNKATILSVKDFKILDNFVLKSGSDVYYVEDAKDDYKVEDLFDANDDVISNISIYMFKEVFVTADYDLSDLLDEEAFDAAEAEVEARVAALKAVTDKIIADRKTIVDSLKEKKVVNVSLTSESAVNALWATYKTLSANGFQPNETYAWVYNSADTVKAYESKLLLTDDIIYDLTYLKGQVDTLRTFADNLVETFKTLHEANKNFAFSVSAGLVTDAKVKNEPTTVDSVTTDHFTTIVSIDVNNGKITTEKDTTGTPLKQDAAVKLAYQAYQNFLTANSKSATSGKTTYAAVENAIATYGFEALKLVVVKMYAYDAVNGITADEAYAADWDKDKDQDFNTHKTMQLAIITDAVNKNAIAVNLKHFHELTGVDYVPFTLFGDTFGANGLIGQYQ